MKLHRRPQSVDQLIECLEARALLGGDHPSLADFPDATEITMVDYSGIESSIGMEYGEIETEGDDDLFMFTADYTADCAIVVFQTAVGGLAPAIQLFDDTGTPLSTLFDGANGGAAVFPIPLTYITQGDTYYINIRAGTPSDVNEPNITGTYRVQIVQTIPSPSYAAPTNELAGQAPEGNFNAAPTGFGAFDEIEDGYVFDPIVDGDGPSVTLNPVEHSPLMNGAIGAALLIPATLLNPAATLGGDFSLSRVDALPGAIPQQTSTTFRAERATRSAATLELFDSNWDTSALAASN